MPPGHFFHRTTYLGDGYLAHTTEFEQEINMFDVVNQAARVARAAGKDVPRSETVPAPKRYPVATGEMRGRLQPVVFMHLLEPVGNPNGPETAAGEMISVQHWGPGIVAVNAVRPGTQPVMVDDRTLHARWAHLDGTTEVTTAELRANLQPVIFGRLAEDVVDNSDDSVGLPVGRAVALQFWGGGMTAVTDVLSGVRVVARTNTVHIAWDHGLTVA